MGMRFRKSFGGKGFRVNVSKSGIGYSVGGKGFRYTKKAGGGSRTTISIPGTGISYVKDSKTGKMVPVATTQFAPLPKWLYKTLMFISRAFEIFFGLLALILVIGGEVGLGITFAVIVGIMLISGRRVKMIQEEYEDE